MSNCFLVVGGNLNSRQEIALKKLKYYSGDKNWQEDNNPDFFFFAADTSIGIEEIRELQIQLNLKPFSQKVKTALILRAENLTSEAQNALLKTLEEPPENTIIALTAPDQSWLLPTIVSRCQIIQLPLTAQISLTNEEFKESQAMFCKITSPKIGERWQTLEKLGIYQDRLKAIEWVDKMIFFVRKLLIDSYLKKEKNSPNNHSISPFQRNSPKGTYLNILISLSKTKSYLQANTNVRLTLENFLLDLPLLNC